jgi:hypothetical protein
MRWKVYGMQKLVTCRRLDTGRLPSVKVPLSAVSLNETRRGLLISPVLFRRP